MKEIIEKVKDNYSETLVPIEHSIVDGVYTRIAYAKANTIISGCPHVKGGTAILLAGTIQQIDGDEHYEITAPKIFNTKPGSQRIARTLTDTIYATCHSTEAKTVEEAEKLLFIGTPQLTRIRESFNSLLIEMKTSEEEIKKEMNLEPIIIEDSDKFHISDSIIHGKGCYSSSEYKPNDIIGVAIKDNKRFSLARYVNHSDIPNCKFVRKDNGDVDLIATRNIPQNVELFVDYTQEKLKCQE